MVAQYYELWHQIWHPNIYVLESEFFSIKWYGLLFAIGVVLGRYFVRKSYQIEKRYRLSSEIQIIYVVVGTLFGSRIGHILFYNPEILKKNFFQIFFFWEGGLSSHGAAIGILFCLAIYSFKIKWKKYWIQIKDRNRNGYSYYQILDRIVIGIAIGASLVRLGNFINSEIIGKTTGNKFGVVLVKPVEERIKKQLPFVEKVIFNKTSSFFGPGKPNIETKIIFHKEKFKESRIRKSIKKRLAFIFPKTENEFNHIINPLGSELKYTLNRSKTKFVLQTNLVGVNRYPTQLFESFAYFLISVLLFILWKKHLIDLRPGSLLGLFLMLVFLFRFLIEFIKENQVTFENSLYLNMGQILSIPMILLGFYFFFSTKKLGAAFRLYN